MAKIWLVWQIFANGPQIDQNLQLQKAITSVLEGVRRQTWTFLLLEYVEV